MNHGGDELLIHPLQVLLGAGHSLHLVVPARQQLLQPNVLDDVDEGRGLRIDRAGLRGAREGRVEDVADLVIEVTMDRLDQLGRCAIVQLGKHQADSLVTLGRDVRLVTAELYGDPVARQQADGLREAVAV